MDILFITRNLPPYIGGMERLIWNSILSLQKNFKIETIGPPGSSRYLSSKVYEIDDKSIKNFLFEALKIAASKKAKIYFAGSGLTAPVAILAAKKNKAKSCSYFHGLDLASSHFIYSLLWKNSFRLLDFSIVNSHDTLKRAYMIKKKYLLHPGVDISVPKRSFKEEYNIKDDYIIYAGRITKRKGLDLFIKNSFRKIIDKYPNLKLVIIGPESRNSILNDSLSIKSLKKELKKLNLENNAVFIDPIDPSSDLLASAFKEALVHIFPVQNIENNPEGFGMVAIEAASQATPTVAFSCAGVVDAVKDEVSGSLIEPGNFEEFSNKVIYWIKNRVNEEEIKKFAESFSWPNFSKRLNNIIEKELKNS